VLQVLQVRRATRVLLVLLVLQGRMARMVLLVLRHLLGSQRAVCAALMEQHRVLLVCKALVAEQLCMLTQLMRCPGMTI
jgi:hypothetical protein